VVRAQSPLSLAVPLAVVACTTGPDVRLPWWRAPRTTLPSPLLDAVGLAPPDLTEPGCLRDGGGGAGWRGSFDHFLHGYGWSCRRPLTVAASNGALADRGLVAASFDPRGRAYHAAYTSAEQHLGAAQAAVDSAITYGLHLPGARALTCPNAARTARPGEWIDSTIRGWQTPDYQTVVFVEEVWSYPARGYTVNVQVSRDGFVLWQRCRPRASATSAGHRAPAA